MNQDGIDCWTPFRILEALEKGWPVPGDWRARLQRAGYLLPEDDNLTLFDISGPASAL